MTEQAGRTNYAGVAGARGQGPQTRHTEGPCYDAGLAFGSVRFWEWVASVEAGVD